MSQQLHSQFHFNNKEDYNTILDSMSRDFNERWNKQTQSPYTNLENYVQRAVLGNGSFGTVLLVREKTGKNYYAAKMMSKEDLVRLKQVNHVHNEKTVLSAARFPFLVHLIDSSKDFDYLYLVLPFVNGGELFSYHRNAEIQREAEPLLRLAGGAGPRVHAPHESHVPRPQAREHPAGRQGIHQAHRLWLHEARGGTHHHAVWHARVPCPRDHTAEAVQQMRRLVGLWYSAL
ncbi:cAMP-dependent protein kinase catalytic subunit 2-like isoform X4 [Drosophila obscura]|uniref:cAMP-dependent protein kinase catalytic subunit 2-like isoform X4 n=1 Tax=Drosophila obscura TaxID=7282 RepID=UPI001BB114AC|nr:cAMP-dependent protein kinase catalytic subunit 2-like isoform X4 [Drosophila obscura]